MSHSRDSVRLQIKNPNIREALEGVIASMDGLDLQPPGALNPCNLLILEIGEDLEKEFQLIHDIHASGEVEAIFVTSSRFEAEILVQALRAGVKEFFSQPIQLEELANALRKFKERQPGLPGSEIKRKKGKIIHIMGGKGGVGTTTVAVNLSTSLAQANPSQLVALVDMNLLFGEIPTFLDVQSDFSWGEIVKHISRLDATYLTSVLAKHPSGMFVLPSPTGLDGMTPATPEIIEKLLTVMEETFDFVVIDGGQSIDEISLKVFQMADAVLVVSVLSLPCLTNVKRLLWTFQKLGFPQKENVKVLVNRYHKRSLISLEEAEKTIDQGIFWQIPNDFQTTMSAINQGKDLFSIAPGSEISKNFKKFSTLFIDETVPKETRNGFWGKWLK
jgi:pilus assembly protein CpaE